MSQGTAQNKKKRNPLIEGVFHTVDWVVFAVSVTLIFLVFGMRAYTIPTGSMADTLRGAHFRLRCSQCGYRYDYDFLRRAYRISGNRSPKNNVAIQPGQPRCPSCGYYRQSAQKMPVIRGDRIFVLKCIYQFFEPNRWDVAVFNPPIEPKINYIKRMIGLPGETVEIIDGDVFIDGKIARKPSRVQKELWMPVYDNDYQPINPSISRFNGHTWRQPFKNDAGSQWNLHAEGPTVFGLSSEPDQKNTIIYQTSVGNDFTAAHAYDYQDRKFQLPICSDLKICFDVRADSEGIAGAGLGKYGILYEGYVDFSGKLVIERVESSGQRTELGRKSCESVTPGSPVHFSFCNVDHQLIVEFGRERLMYDLGRGSEDVGTRRTELMPEASIFGAGELRMSHVKLFRDIYYYDAIGDKEILRAGEGKPFTLGKDEFFVLGDNSPASRDSRWWKKPGLGNNGMEYRKGVVPRDYLVGKAFVVFWPGGQRPFEKSPINFIPYVGGMKIIAGGSYK